MCEPLSEKKNIVKQNRTGTWNMFDPLIETYANDSIQLWLQMIPGFFSKGSPSGNLTLPMYNDFRWVN